MVLDDDFYPLTWVNAAITAIPFCIIAWKIHELLFDSDLWGFYSILCNILLVFRLSATVKTDA